MEAKETVTIDASPDRVWAVVGNFQDMSWHPAVEKTEGRNGNAVGASRRLTLGGGGTIDEALSAYDAEAMSYAYRITKVDVKVLPVTDYSSRLSVKAAGGGTSLVEWSGAFQRGDPRNDPAAGLNDEAAVNAVSGVYRGGLDALKSKVESGA